MKLNFGLLRRRWHMPLLLATGFLPVPLALCAKMAPQALWMGLPVVAVYVLFAWLCIVFPGRLRLAAAVAGAVLIVAVGLWLLPWKDALLLPLIPIVYAYLLFAGLANGGEETPPVYPCVGAGLHVVVQIMQLFDANSGTQMPTAVIYALRAAFVAYGFLTLLSLNRVSLREAAAKGSPAPLTVKRRNLLLTMALGCMTLLIACLPAVLRFFKRIWNGFVAAVKRLWEILDALFASEGPAEGGDMQGLPDSLMGAGSETSMFWKVMEKILIGIAVAFVLVVAVVVLRMLWRKLKALAALGLRRLQEYARAASEDYQDEISDTREGGERTSLLHRIVRRRDPLKGIDETKLSPRERIRFYYLKVWLKRPDWEAGRTARENLSADAAGIYERARYSPHDVSEAEAEEFGRKVLRGAAPEPRSRD